MSDGRGTYQTFDYGTVYHTATTCAHAIYGEVWRVWSNWIRGWNHDPDRSPREAFPDPLYSVPVVLSANPALGYPIGEEHDAPGGGRVQEFEFGSIASRATDTPRLKCIAQNMALLAYRSLSRHRTRPCDSSADRSRPGQSVRCGWLVRMFRGWRTGKNWERPPRYLPAPFSGRSRRRRSRVGWRSIADEPAPHSRQASDNLSPDCGCSLICQQGRSPRSHRDCRTCERLRRFSQSYAKPGRERRESRRSDSSGRT